MGASQRTKGQVGERELCAILSRDLGLDLTRNLDQVREGGADILGVPGFIIECKRCQVLNKAMWWKQVVKAGLQYPHLIPVVAYRMNRQPWRYMLPLWLIVVDAEQKEFLEVDHGGFIKLFATRQS